MLLFRNKKGFTLIEIVLVLVLLGILAAVAATKYYDLRDKAEYARACAYANQFSAELNTVCSKKILEGKTCLTAREEALEAIGGKYTIYNSEGLAIATTPFYTDYPSEITVYVSQGAGAALKEIKVPSGVLACDKVIPVSTP
ncbi:prepilin-type N-terminal cleavage/methylation domain-containing protein [uncultured Duodenibacillus sp.]|uniref:prepilin-type N-terminal cleavage/methylation domain-containing protein n=1 Tax=uncultured Duodenibacillus sp. TaxID=1980699 RepID=UPI002594BC96|nr:prepilin-type N-terminal cleavage/methylation domain-containing protein [uncultured Duodenibacillus sp.]